RRARALTSPRLPYTTLFRSHVDAAVGPVPGQLVSDADCTLLREVGAELLDRPSWCDADDIEPHLRRLDLVDDLTHLAHHPVSLATAAVRSSSRRSWFSARRRSTTPLIFFSSSRVFSASSARLASRSSSRPTSCAWATSSSARDGS